MIVVLSPTSQSGLRARTRRAAVRPVMLARIVVDVATIRESLLAMKRCGRASAGSRAERPSPRSAKEA